MRCMSLLFAVYFELIRQLLPLSSSPSAPCCTSHRRPAVLRVVHKEGENKGRQFYTCSLPRETKCNFFEVEIVSMAVCTLKNISLSIPSLSLKIATH